MASSDPQERRDRAQAKFSTAQKTTDGTDDLNRIHPRGESSKSASHRPRGRSFEREDQPIIEAMRRLVQEGDEPSPSLAAKRLIGRSGRGARGSGTFESKIRRLLERYTKQYGE
jgi:hypothetical protein